MAAPDSLIDQVFDGRYKRRPQARHGRHGERLPRRGPGARAPRRDQDARRPARAGRAVRRALPPRGEERGRALAPEHRLHLRPRRGRTARTTSRWSTSRGARSRSCSSRAARRRSRSRSTTRGRSSPRSGSRTATASSTATSSRTTSSSRRDGRLKVMDFGIARAGASQMTETGSIIGTAQYLSPEQAKGAPVDPRSDLYSVGIVLYEMLTGVGPVHRRHAARDRDEAPLGDPGAAVGAARPRCRTSSTRSSCARSRSAPRTATSRPRRWTPTSPASRRGQAVAPETEEAATQVLRGVGAATAISARRREVVRRPPGSHAAARLRAADRLLRVRRADPPPLVLALAARRAPRGRGAVAGGWYVYTKIQDQLDETKPVSVPLVQGSSERLAVQKLRDAGLQAQRAAAAERQGATSAASSTVPAAGRPAPTRATR